MEDEIESSSGASMLPIALALFAAVLGGAGLYFGMNASRQLMPLTESVDAGSSSSARLNKQIESLETRVAELSAQNRQLKESLQRTGRETSQALRSANQAASGVSANRDELVKLASSMQEFAKSGARPSAPSSARPKTGASETSEATASASPGTYAIQSGDTFGKIASKLGVSLDALLQANPDADPRRLSIGQEIIVPGN